MAVLCLDLGGTKSNAALFAGDGTVLARATGPAGAVSLGAEVTLAAVNALWDGVHSGGLLPEQTDLMIGLAGIGLRDRVREVKDRLGHFRAVHCVSDGYGALIDATGAAPGVLVVIGTGVVAMRLNADGSFLTASGWGFPAGDLGGGAWIGLQATAGLTRFLDGVQTSAAMQPDLAGQLMAVTGQDASAIMAWLTSGRAGDYARLAPIIAASDDPFARDLLSLAATEIGLMADVLGTAGTGTIHLAGGLGPVLLPYCRAQSPRHDWHLSEADPLRGLFLVSTGQAPPEKLSPRPGLSRADYRD
jgi:glucosamine kinase